MSAEEFTGIEPTLPEQLAARGGNGHSSTSEVSGTSAGENIVR